MNSDELITQVDENDRVLGLRTRSEFADGKLIHRSSYLLLFNLESEVLLQRRSILKKWHPGEWTFPVAGTVANETYEECMEREIEEVFGTKIPFKQLFTYHHFDDVDKAFKTVFIAKAERTDLVLKATYAEEFDWLTLTKLRQELRDHPKKYARPFIVGMKIFFEKYSDPGLLLESFG